MKNGCTGMILEIIDPFIQHFNLLFLIRVEDCEGLIKTNRSFAMIIVEKSGGKDRKMTLGIRLGEGMNIMGHFIKKK